MKYFETLGHIIELLLYQDIQDERHRGKFIKKIKPSYSKTEIITDIVGVRTNDRYQEIINHLIDNKCLVLDERRSKKSGRDYYFIIENELCKIYKNMDMCKVLELNHTKYILQ